MRSIETLIRRLHPHFNIKPRQAQLNLCASTAARVALDADLVAPPAALHIGVQPHIRVAPTVADFRAGQDTVLGAALAHLRRELQAPVHSSPAVAQGFAAASLMDSITIAFEPPRV